MKLDAIIVLSVSMAVTGFIVNAPAVRSRLKTPTLRAVVAGLLAGALAVGGLLIERLVVNAR
jgi:hypothetical protein